MTACDPNWGDLITKAIATLGVMVVVTWVVVLAAWMGRNP